MGHDDHGESSGRHHTDAVLDALSNRRRRLLLSLLRSNDRPLAIADAAREIAHRQYDVPYEQLSVDELENVYISLHHVHVPKLVNLGLVTYDADRNTVALADSPDLLAGDGASIQVEHASSS